MNIIDTHNHSLPGIDDGAKDLNMALEMLRVAQNSGTTDVILTPHHLNGVFNNFADDVKKATEGLRVAASNEGIEIKLHIGSEIHLVPETVEHLVENKALTYCGLGKAALIELPKTSIPTGVESILSELIYHNITPVIAHPERNSTLRSDIGPLREWVDFGCKAQLTGASCSGKFGKEIQAVSYTMISERLVHIIASDAHRPQGRSPSLSLALQSISQEFGANTAELLFARNPRALLEGKALENLTVSLEGNSRTKKTRKRQGLFSKIFS